jgi:phosphoribosylformylglycinamidine (FGAM) synthase-like amidotransferase family enzyme
VLTIPINHFEGNFYGSPETLAALEGEERVAFRYCSASGETDEASNPNGSMWHIAGVLSEGRNVLGMMPHPERATDPEVGGIDGQVIFTSLVSSIAAVA